MRRASWFLTLALLLTSCGGSDGAGEGIPAGSFTFTSGEATLSVTGELEERFELSLSSLGTNDYVGEGGEGLLTLSYSIEDGVFMSIDLEWTPESEEPAADVSLDLDDGNNYLGGGCTVVVSSFTEASISGTFECTDFEGIEQTGSTGGPPKNIALEGSFSAAT